MSDTEEPASTRRAVITAAAGGIAALSGCTTHPDKPLRVEMLEGEDNITVETATHSARNFVGDRQTLQVKVDVDGARYLVWTNEVGRQHTADEIPYGQTACEVDGERAWFPATGVQHIYAVKGGELEWIQGDRTITALHSGGKVLAEAKFRIEVVE